LFTFSISCKEPWITFQWLFDRKQGESSVCFFGSCNFALKKCFFFQTGNVCFCHRTNKTLTFSQLLKRNDQYWSLLIGCWQKKRALLFFLQAFPNYKKNKFTFLASKKKSSFWKAYCRNKYFGKLQVWNSPAFLSAFEKNKSLFNSFKFLFWGREEVYNFHLFWKWFNVFAHNWIKTNERGDSTPTWLTSISIYQGILHWRWSHD